MTCPFDGFFIIFIKKIKRPLLKKIDFFDFRANYPTIEIKRKRVRFIKVINQMSRHSNIDLGLVYHTIPDNNPRQYKKNERKN